MKLSEKLVSLRKEKGWTQLELAERLNVSRQAISRWEIGHAVPSIDNLKFLSELYGVPVDYLLHDDAEEPCKKEESQMETCKEPWWKEAGQKRISISLGMLVCGLLLVLALLLLILTISKQREAESQTDIISITDLSCDPSPNDYPVETFQLLWP